MVAVVVVVTAVVVVVMVAEADGVAEEAEEVIAAVAAVRIAVAEDVVLAMPEAEAEGPLVAQCDPAAARASPHDTA